MNHAITVGGILLFLMALAGAGIAFIGLLMVMAAGMSDAGDDGTGGRGCGALLVGVGLLGLAFCLAVL